MKHGKTISFYLTDQTIQKLDQVRENIPRSKAIQRLLDYLLAQDVNILVSIIGK
jgi:hypothetical protein